jgi:hypothetical protein
LLFLVDHFENLPKGTLTYHVLDDETTLDDISRLSIKDVGTLIAL